MMCLLAAAGSAHAATITTFTTRAAFDAAVGATTIETFDGFSTDVSFAPSLDVGAFTMAADTTAAAEYNHIDVAPFTFSEADVNGTTYAMVQRNAGQSFFLTFDTPTRAFGADFSDINNDEVRTRIFVGSDMLTPGLTGTDGLPGGNLFFGFLSDTPFTVVEFRAMRSDGFGMDDVAFTVTPAAVPEPTSIALLASGLVGVLLRRRRKR